VSAINHPFAGAMVARGAEIMGQVVPMVIQSLIEASSYEGAIL